MTIYQNLFNLFPETNSIALAALYGIKLDALDEFKLSNNIYIMKKRDEFDHVYHPRLDKNAQKPDYYLVGIATDKRYCLSFRKIDNIDDVLSSLTIAHQTLCIYNNAPYGLGPVHGFLKNSMGSYGLADPMVSGRNAEHDFDLFKLDAMSFSFYRQSNRSRLDKELVEFYCNVATAYVEVKEKRWLLAAMKYTSGLNKQYAEDVILDFAVALESLLSLDKEQIGFKLRLYLSLLVGQSYSERLQINEDMKKFYTLRSKYVHGNRVKITEDNISVVERVGTYLSKALIKTCGVNIEKDLIKELDFMSLLGSPKYIHEKTQLMITEKDIVEIICKYHGIQTLIQHNSYLSRDNAPDDDYTELVIDVFSDGVKYDTYPVSFYLTQIQELKSVRSFNYWLSQDNERGFYYCINYKT